MEEPSRLQNPQSSTDEDRAEQIAKKSGIFAIGEAVLGLSHLAVAIILTRSLDKSAFAEISLIILIYTSAIAMGGFNIHQSVFYFIGRLNTEKQKRFVRQTTAILLTTGGIAALIVVALRFVGPSWGYQLEGRMWKLALVVLLELPTLPLVNLLLSRDRATSAALINVFSGLAILASLTIPLVTGLGIDVALYCLVAYAGVRALLFGVIVFRLFPGPIAPRSHALFKEQITYSLPLGFAMLTAMLNRQIDKYLVAAFLPQDEFAVYVVGAHEIPLVTVLPYAVGAVLMIRFVKGYADGEQASLLKIWHNAVFHVSLVVLPLTVLFLIIGEDLAVLLFSEDYRGASLPFRIYTVILFHRVAEYGLVLRAAGDTKSLWMASIILLVSNIMLSVPLVFLLGMPGPALATLIANIPAWLYVLHRIGRCLGADLKTVFPWRGYLKVLAVSALVGAVVAPIAIFNPWGPAACIGMVVPAFIGVYVVAVQLLGITNVRDWLAIVRRSKGRDSEPS